MTTGGRHHGITIEGSSGPLDANKGIMAEQHTQPLEGGMHDIMTEGSTDMRVVRQLQRWFRWANRGQ